jgi:membrane fusion protein (multidrug efflux system)
MFRIQPITYQAEFRRAEAEAKAAGLEYQNTKQLADSNVVSETQLALAQAKFEQAQAELSLAQAHLSFTEIHAPFSGIMDRLHLREGSLVDEGELLTTLSDNSTMWVYFNVPEAEYLDYATDPLGIQNARNPADGKWSAVRRTRPHRSSRGGLQQPHRHHPLSRRLRQPDEAAAPRTDRQDLLSKPIPEALLVPQKATFEILDQTYVYVLDDSGKVRQQRIVIGDELEDVFVVDEGLQGRTVLSSRGCATCATAPSSSMTRGA